MKHKYLSASALLLALAQPATQPLHAAEISVTVDIPRHKERPYVAIWLERDNDHRVVRHLSVWHEGGRPAKPGKKKKDKRDKYLRDLPAWWRAGGRDETMPMDGVSGPTRPAGRHTLHFQADAHPLGELEPGDYQLVVEASREDGDQELISLPLAWPPKQAHSTTEEGDWELNAVTLEVRP